MKHIITLLLAVFTSTLNANAQAVYLTTVEKDTAAVNLDAKPVVCKEENKLVIRVNGNNTRTVEIKEGLKLSFGDGLLMGDANRDGAVTMEDAKAVADDFLGKDANIDINTADINLNGKTDMNDATTIVNQVVNKR